MSSVVQQQGRSYDSVFWVTSLSNLMFKCEGNLNSKISVFIAIVLHVNNKGYLFPKEVWSFDLCCRSVDKTKTFSTSNKSFFFNSQALCSETWPGALIFHCSTSFFWTIDEFETEIKYSCIRSHKRLCRWCAIVLSFFLKRLTKQRPKDLLYLVKSTKLSYKISNWVAYFLTVCCFIKFQVGSLPVAQASLSLHTPRIRIYCLGVHSPCVTDNWF